jgi:hypothetical protein
MSDRQTTAREPSCHVGRIGFRLLYCELRHDLDLCFDDEACWRLVISAIITANRSFSYLSRLYTMQFL